MAPNNAAMGCSFARVVSALCVFAAASLILTGTLIVHLKPKYPHYERPVVIGMEPLNRTYVVPGVPIKPGTTLRILCAGDSITSGWLSDQDGGDGNGYRLQLRKDLSADEVVFAGTVSTGSMSDPYFAAWPGKTIKYIGDHIRESLEQRPNLILLHAGTNDMDDRPGLGKEGNDPESTAGRLGALIDEIVEACPDAVVLVAIIINTCAPHKAPTTPEYQSLIPKVVNQRRVAGHHVVAVDFTTLPMSTLRDCIHPTNDGYKEMGHYWYDFLTQIPEEWISQPAGDDPVREESGATRPVALPKAFILVGLLIVLGSFL